MKHFELATNETNPELMRRLETRFLVCDTNGGVYGLTYKWRPDNSDADLLTNSLLEAIVITTTSGTRTQSWFYPSRQDCLNCHNSNAKYILGAKTTQLNRNYTYPSSGVTDNQLRTWNHLGLLNPPLNEAALTNLPAMASSANANASLELRVRSYLDANCAQCHRPNGVQAYFDARFETPLTNQSIINGILNDNEEIPGAKVVVPTNILKSILRYRLATTGADKMPPLARNVTDSNAVNVLDAWINSLPPPPDLPPPWLHRDIGAVGLNGDADFSAGTFLAIGSGADIYGNSDSFHYIYQSVTGNVQVITRVKSLPYTDPWAKAGIMIRQSLDDYSRHVLMTLSPGNGANLQYRLDNFDSTSNASGVTNAAPYWIKLTRNGNLFTGYSSPDGLDWTVVGTVSNALPPTAYVGLVVCSHNNSVLNTAAFESVSVETSPLPSLGPIADATVNEGSPLLITNLTAQPGNPTNSLTFHLFNTSPAGMSINATNGTIQWTPTEAQGPDTYTVTAYVSENNNSALIAARTFNVTVNEVNQPPVLGAITNREISLGRTLSLSLSATDPDLPVNAISFTLGSGAPGGMNLNTNSGLLSWTPSALQSPSTNLVTVLAHDDGTPRLSATQSFTIVVTPPAGSTNLPLPWINEDIGSVGVGGHAQFDSGGFTAAGSGADIFGNADGFHFIHRNATGDVQFVARVVSLQPTDPWAKAGIMIRRSTDDFSAHVFMAATPEYGVNYQFRQDNYGVSDNVSGPTNTAPVWVKLVRNGYNFYGYASNNGTNWSLVHVSSNQMPATVQLGLAVCSHDNNALSSATFDNVAISLLGTNTPPTLDPVPDQTILKGSTLTLTNHAHDTDIPPNALTFSLGAGAPTGLSLGTNSGILIWTPSGSQGGTTNPVSVRVTDDGVPPLTATQSFSIVVINTNLPPTLAPISNYTIVEGSLFTLTNTASDPDVPANILTFSLGTNAPAGMTLNASNGVLSWTPSPPQAPSSNYVSVRVTDDGFPPLSATQSFTLYVLQSNPPPVQLPSPWQHHDIGDVGLPGNAGFTNGTFTNLGAGADIFGNYDGFHFIHRAATGDLQIVARVVGLQPTDPWAKAGVMIRRTTNDFSGHVFMAVTPGNGINYQFRQDDYGLSSNVSGPTNPAPYWVKLTRLGNNLYGYASPNGHQWTLVAVSSNNLPANVEIGLAVTAHNRGALNSASFDHVSVTGLGTNNPPVLETIANRVVHAQAWLAIPAPATHPDSPPDFLTFSLLTGNGLGATLDPSSGLFLWRPDNSFANTTNDFTIRVADHGSPALSATQSFTVAVFPPLLIERITLTGQVVTVGWSAIPGAGYYLQKNATLGANTWTNLPGEVIAPGPIATKQDTLDGTVRRFYRVIFVP